MRIAVIGAGASGLLSSIVLSKAGYSVDLFEQNNKIAKKILASGNGKCNISNKNISLANYSSSNISFLNPILKRFGFEEFEKFSRSIGLILKTKESGQVYPMSDEAKTVSRVLQHHIMNYGVRLHLDTEVIKISKNDNKFIIKTNNKDYIDYDYTIIATGSNSAHHLGGSESGYKFAKDFGHSIENIYPSLVQLKSNLKNIINISGVKINSIVTTYIDSKKILAVEGDLLFTKFGISGLAVLDSSNKISLALNQSRRVKVSINFLPNLSRDIVENIITSSLGGKNRVSIELILSSILPYKLAIFLLDNLDIDRSSISLSRKILKKLIYSIFDFDIDIIDTNGFKSSEVTGGGVNVDEIHSKTMESKFINNLYFCGELLDILGDRGGYNLHFAWASGYIAANSIINRGNI